MGWEPASRRGSDPAGLGKPPEGCYLKPSGKPTRGALGRVTVESDLHILKGALAALFICAETHLYGGGQERRGEASGGAVGRRNDRASMGWGRAGRCLLQS